MKDYKFRFKSRWKHEWWIEAFFFLNNGLRAEVGEFKLPKWLHVL